MALTSTTLVDVVNSTQTITFYESAVQVDQIVYANNQITFEAASVYNISQSDLSLYYGYLKAYFNNLLVNFPVISASGASIWPLCQFEINETHTGILSLTYNQTSNGILVLNIAFLPSLASASFTGRASPVTITMQEFFMTMNMLFQYINQTNLN